MTQRDDDGSIFRAQEEAGNEIASDIVHAIVKAKKRHGDDPEFPQVAAAGIGGAIEKLGMIDDIAMAVLGVALVERWERATGQKLPWSLFRGERNSS